MADNPKRTIDHKAFHMIGMTIRQGRPSPIVCPSCEMEQINRRAAQQQQQASALPGRGEG